MFMAAIQYINTKSKYQYIDLSRYFGTFNTMMDKTAQRYGPPKHLKSITALPRCQGEKTQIANHRYCYQFKNRDLNPYCHQKFQYCIVI